MHRCIVSALFAAVPFVLTVHAQTNPPGFGLVHFTSDFGIRINVVCFEHPVNVPRPTRAMAGSCSITARAMC